VSDHRAQYPVRVMCRVLGVSPSGYYAWKKRGPSERTWANWELLKEIRAIHKWSDGTYGAPRVQEELEGRGIRVSVNRVARLMREDGLQGVSRRSRPKTTRWFWTHGVDGWWAGPGPSGRLHRRGNAARASRTKGNGTSVSPQAWGPGRPGSTERRKVISPVFQGREGGSRGAREKDSSATGVEQASRGTTGATRRRAPRPSGEV